MSLRWSFWILWVIANAATSFCWSILLDNSLPYFAGILVGIACFIVFYTLLDGYLQKKQYFSAQQALVRGVYIKAGLQILNLLAFAGLMNFIPEVWAGSVATAIASRLTLQPPGSFLYALLATLLTGAFLSVLVGVISILTWAITKSTTKRKS